MKKSVLLVAFLLLQCSAFALNSGTMPADINSNANTLETVVGWVLKIGGIGAIAYACISFARNKLQGQAVDTVVYLIIGLGALLFGVGWWVGKASSVQGFLF